MAYVDPNVKTKKALKAAVDGGLVVIAFQPGGTFPLSPTTGEVTVEGPHYPEPHRWYARVEIKDCQVVRVIS